MNAPTMTSDERTQLKALGQGINLSVLRDKIGHLEGLFNRKQEAAQDYKDAAQVVAIEAGIIPSVLNQFIAARATDTVSKKSRSAEQLSLLFGEDI